MATAVLLPRDVTTPFNYNIPVSSSRFVPRSIESSSSRTTSPNSCGKSHRRRRRDRSADSDRSRKKKEARYVNEAAIEDVKILKSGENLCPNLTKRSADVNKRNGVLRNVFAGNGFSKTPIAMNLPLPNMNWLNKLEDNITIDEPDAEA